MGLNSGDNSGCWQKILPCDYHVLIIQEAAVPRVLGGIKRGHRGDWKTCKNSGAPGDRGDGFVTGLHGLLYICINQLEP